MNAANSLESIIRCQRVLLDTITLDFSLCIFCSQVLRQPQLKRRALHQEELAVVGLAVAAYAPTEQKRLKKVVRMQ
ncbi:MAG: hypothetical protein VW980_00450 [Flavobacteriales bacterium]